MRDSTITYSDFFKSIEKEINIASGDTGNTIEDIYDNIVNKPVRKTLSIFFGFLITIALFLFLLSIISLLFLDSMAISITLVVFTLLLYYFIHDFSIHPFITKKKDNLEKSYNDIINTTFKVDNFILDTLYTKIELLTPITRKETLTIKELDSIKSRYIKITYLITETDDIDFLLINNRT